MDVHLSKIKVRLPGQDSPLFQIKDLRIPQGSRLLIQGPSGKGKTTLLHLIAGLFLPDEGTVSFGENHLTSMNDEARSHLRRQKMGLVFQTLNLVDHLTAFENVLLGLPVGPKAHQESQGKVRQALDRVGLSGREKDLSAHLSLGERQRVAVARVLAGEPTLVLADEPTSSLDQVNAEKVLDYFFSLPANCSLIMVSHDERIRKRFATTMTFNEVTAR